MPQWIHPTNGAVRCHCKVTLNLWHEKVNPIFKKSKKKDPGNYMPVSPWVLEKWWSSSSRKPGCQTRWFPELHSYLNYSVILLCDDNGSCETSQKCRSWPNHILFLLKWHSINKEQQLTLRRQYLQRQVAHMHAFTGQSQQIILKGVLILQVFWKKTHWIVTSPRNKLNFGELPWYLL